MVFTPSTAIGDHFAFLRHAEWDGITRSDWIFPAFLVTSGLSLSLLLRNPSKQATHRRLARRLITGSASPRSEHHPTGYCATPARSGSCSSRW